MALEKIVKIILDDTTATVATAFDLDSVKVREVLEKALKVNSFLKGKAPKTSKSTKEEGVKTSTLEEGEFEICTGWTPTNHIVIGDLGVLKKIITDNKIKCRAANNTVLGSGYFIPIDQFDVLKDALEEIGKTVVVRDAKEIKKGGKKAKDESEDSVKETKKEVKEAKKEPKTPTRTPKKGKTKVVKAILTEKNEWGNAVEETTGMCVMTWPDTSDLVFIGRQDETLEANKLDSLYHLSDEDKDLCKENGWVFLTEEMIEEVGDKKLRKKLAKILTREAPEEPEVEEEEEEEAVESDEDEDEEEPEPEYDESEDSGEVSSSDEESDDED